MTAKEFNDHCKREDTLDLHDNPVQRCDCKQCKIAWQSLAAAKLTDLISKDEHDEIVLQAVKDNQT